MSENEGLLDSVRRDELVYAYVRLQNESERSFPDTYARSTILSRYRGLWEFAGALHLGVFCAATTILLNFIVVNLLLHLPP